MNQTLSVRDLVRITGGSAFELGWHRGNEGLVGRLRTKGNILGGRVWDLGTFRPRLELVPPFHNRCSCPEGGACSHVAALGLEWLYQQNKAGTHFSSADRIILAVQVMDVEHLRGLSLELMSSLPGGVELADAFLARVRAKEQEELTRDYNWHPPRKWQIPARGLPLRRRSAD